MYLIFVIYRGGVIYIFTLHCVVLEGLSHWPCSDIILFSFTSGTNRIVHIRVSPCLAYLPFYPVARARRAGRILCIPELHN
jgi:hypothetical protein